MHHRASDQSASRAAFEVHAAGAAHGRGTLFGERQTKYQLQIGVRGTDPCGAIDWRAPS